jgi:hypothetical protein
MPKKLDKDEHTRQRIFFNFDTDSRIGKVYHKSCHTYTVPVFPTAGQTDTVDLEFTGNKSQSQAKYSSQVTFFAAMRIFTEHPMIILMKGSHYQERDNIILRLA